MSYTSFAFFLFTAAAAAVYFLLPLKIRWVALLAASIGFYTMADLKSLPILLIEAMLAYCGGLLLMRDDSKTSPYRRRVLLAVLILLIGYLAFVKLMRFIRPGSSIVMAVGLSYYTFSNISYICDIYWRRYKAEKNPLKYILFVSFFPHIIQGPIPRFDRLAPQLVEGHRFEYKRVTFGIQLILFGLLQKLVLADRLGIFVDSVFDDYQNQYGIITLAAIFFYAIQIYMDFAGCVNIARGTAQIFGVELEENFRQPYFAISVDEFWRRWHMTLGGFFRDYVGMPVSVSKPVKKWSKSARKRFGRDAGKLVAPLCALVVVWICTGLWHGTGLNYLLWGVWQGGIIAFSMIMSKRFASMKARLKISDDSKAFRLFQILRTFLLAGIIPRVITRAPSIHVALVMIKHCFTGTGIYQFHVGKGLEQYGWTRWHFGIAFAVMAVQLIISILKERGVNIRESVAGFVLPLRWLLYLALLFAVILFGIYGPGFDPKAFVYAGF